jgi:hypothetical protein
MSKIEKSNVGQETPGATEESLFTSLTGLMNSISGQNATTANTTGGMFHDNPLEIPTPYPPRLDTTVSWPNTDVVTYPNRIYTTGTGSISKHVHPIDHVGAFKIFVDALAKDPSILNKLPDELLELFNKLVMANMKIRAIEKMTQETADELSKHTLQDE